MKYTRYDYNKKSILNRIIIFCFSVLLMLLAFIMINRFNVKGTDDSINETDKTITPCVIQLGCFSKEENADKAVKEKQSLSPFIVESDGKFKVILGIYHKENAQTIINGLKSENYEVSKEDIMIKNSSKSSSADIEVIDAALKLNDKLTDKDVSSIKTDDFKKWFEKLLSNNNSCVSDAVKQYVQEMPDELNAQNNKDNMKKLYSILKLLQ